MPANAEGVDEFLHARGLGHVVCEVDADVRCPVDRVVGKAQRFENVFVEAVLADQTLVDLLEELARASPLNHAVVIGAGQRDGLADAKFCECLLARALKLGGVLECARADDGSRATHEAGHGVLCAESAGIGE